MHGSHTAVFGSLLGVTLEGAAELVDVVRVVPGHDSEKIVEGASAPRVHLYARALPLRVRESA